MRLYADTNVFIDHLTQRLRCTFFERALVNNWKLVVSQKTFDELSKQGFAWQAANLLKYLKCEFAPVTQLDTSLTSSYKTHPADALHIVVAIRENCDFIITRNKRDFIESPIPVRGPNEKL